MSTPKISVIVPVYKAEQYLHRCVDSILTQTFTDFELLLINDGSPDNCGAICDEYAAKDSRIRVFHKKNGGVSSARNLGLDNAKGEWIAFVDADDWIEDGYLYINDSSSDVIEKSYIIDDLNQKKKIEKRIIKVYSITNRDALFNYYVKKRNNALWNKLISAKLIGSVRFDETVKIGEDFLFFLALVPKIKKYSFSEIGSYCYVIRLHSAMQSMTIDKRMEVVANNINHVQRILADPSLFLLKQGIVYKSYFQYLYKYRNSLDTEKKKILSNLLDEMRWKNMKLLSLKEKVKLYIKKYLYS